MATSPSPQPSPASSSVSLPFPSTSTPKKSDIRSNPHPYAIKTTSTGILTRSNSTHSANSKHHFVPSSPSKPKVNQSRHSGGHKYSRSLNQELPRPLPAPPNVPSSASPTRTEFEQPLHDVRFIARRERRSDTMPSMSQPNLLRGSVTDELPDDPRVWTPSQLSTYLTSSLRVTSGDLPPLAVQDMATFVRTQNINGRKFLRLTEGDLNKYELNQRWQSVLLGASRSLRQESLRGRIWNFEVSPDQDGEEEDDNYESLSSASSRSSTDSIQEWHRGRPESDSGRVKGMVASFERNGPSRSVPSVKGPSLSPVKRINDEPDSDTAVLSSNQFRSRPQSDIFPSRSSYAMTTATAEGSSAVTTSAIANPSIADPDQKKEPRLLPLPPPSTVQVLSPEFTAFGAPPQPVQHMSQGGGVPAFGSYDSPQQEMAFSPPFPSGVLPFSPQTTGTTILSPDDFSDLTNQTRQLEPGTVFTPAQQPQSFDTLYVSALAEGVRPLPLPPHAGQFNQSLVSVSVPQSGYSGIGTNRDRSSGVNMSVPGHVDQVQVPRVLGELIEGTIPVPHVQIQQHIPESSHHPSSSSVAQTPGVDIHHLPLYLHHHLQQPQLHPQPAALQQSDSLHSHSPDQTRSQLLPRPQPQGQGHHHHLHIQPHASSASPPIQILAPQPRHGGRESPTKILEEKLEELLEPRPRSRVFPSQPVSRPHSRVPSISRKKEKGQNPSSSGAPGAPSRPRSRITSMDNEKSVGGNNGSVRGKSSTTAANGGIAGGTAGTEDKAVAGSDTLDVPNINSTKTSGQSLGFNSPNITNSQHHHQHPRTRVISVSSRTLSHRLSGVEAWGENHRHVVVPSSSSSPSLDGETDMSTLVDEDKGVKELEGEEEIGIEALLEKEAPTLPMPVPVHSSSPMPEFDAGTSSPGNGHAKESSTGTIGSSGNGNITHSRSGSLREPKSAVITVVERKSSSRLSKVNISREGEGEGEAGAAEESMEALLAKADSSTSGLGMGLSGAVRNGKKRTPLNGAEAWELVNVDTVKHVDGDGYGAMSKSVEDIFSPSSTSPRLPSSSAIPHGPRPKPASPPIPLVPLLPPQQHQQPGKAKLKAKSKKSVDSLDSASDMATKTRLGELERKEQELEKSVDETRKMVEEMRGRLESIERWIAEKEIESEQKAKEEEAVKRKEQANVWSVKRVLYASGVPGMLGLSAWFSASSSVSSPSSSTSTSTSTSTSKTSTRMTLIRRIAKLGLNLSTYTIWFGIGICMVLLRMLGKRPGVAARLGRVGIGARFLGNGERIFGR